MNGIQCPACGGVDWSVSNTYQEPGRVRRRRVCKSCGTPLQTHETARGSRYITQLANDASNRASGTVPQANTLARFDQEKKQ